VGILREAVRDDDRIFNEMRTLVNNDEAREQVLRAMRIRPKMKEHFVHGALTDNDRKIINEWIEKEKTRGSSWITINMCHDCLWWKKRKFSQAHCIKGITSKERKMLFNKLGRCPYKRRDKRVRIPVNRGRVY
jgi:hypothetical protein